MKTAWYIMILRQIGNVGAHEIKKFNHQPKEGFKSKKEAEMALVEVINKDGDFFTWDSFTILQLWGKV